MIELIIATGVIAFLLFYLAFKLEEKHQAIKVLALFFGLYFMLLLAKSALDTRDQCEIVLMNQTVDGNTTLNQYDKVCFTSTNAIFTTLYTTFLWFFRIVYVYMFGFVIYLFLNYFKNGVKK
jgi:multisubunit Na+/H+ antiporter MnhB subunit